MPRRPNLARISKAQQKSDLDPLLARTEMRVRAHFDAARQSVQPIFDAFAQAYQAEYDRLNADLEDDEEPKTVPLHWLTASGWKRKVEDALAHAAQQAATQSVTAVVHAHDQAARLGEAHGRALVKAAMQPAVNAYVKARRKARKV